jgi:hypothetical protein
MWIAFLYVIGYKKIVNHELLIVNENLPPPEYIESDGEI